MLCAGTIPELAGSDVFNTAVLIDSDGELLTAHRKVHLYRAGGEDVAFRAGSSLDVVQTSRLGRVGVLVCFDGDFFESARTLALAGAELVILPAAYETAAERWWDLLYPAQALGNVQWWVMANQCGDNGSIEFLGRSRVIAPDGEVVAALPDRFARSRVPGHRDQARAATPRRETGRRRPAHGPSTGCLSAVGGDGRRLRQGAKPSSVSGSGKAPGS
jgi:predicted amidohydrolase